MKQNSAAQWKRSMLGGLQGLFSLATLYLLRAGLHIESHPLSITDGWQPFCAWLVIFWLVIRFFGRLLHRFEPQPAPEQRLAPPPDLYMLAQTELEMERTAGPKAC